MIFLTFSKTAYLIWDFGLIEYKSLTKLPRISRIFWIESENQRISQKSNF